MNLLVLMKAAIGGLFIPAVSISLASYRQTIVALSATFN